MRSRVTRSLLVIGMLTAVAGGCETTDEWTTWEQHRTHFASGNHLLFSFRNQEGEPQVTRQDVAAARRESWWGDPVTVSPDQILER